MELIRQHPAPPLDRYIECLWWSCRDEPAAGCEHMLPSGTAQIVFALHESPILCRPAGSDAFMRWSGGLVHGPQSTYYVAGPKPRGVAAGLSLRPGAAGAVLGVPAVELTDRHVPLDGLWGRRAGELHERLMAAADDPLEALGILERHFLARIDRSRTRLERPLLMHPAVAQALAPRRGRFEGAGGGLASAARGTDLAAFARAAELQRASGFSARHFIALFREGVGLTPKHYLRIRRFQAAARRIAAGDALGLGGVAADLGYADQAHFTREFREFAGVAPSRYRPDGRDRPLHHRALEATGRSAREPASR
jgi:AraC-like DNA-binding protein